MFRHMRPQCHRCCSVPVEQRLLFGRIANCTHAISQIPTVSCLDQLSFMRLRHPVLLSLPSWSVLSWLTTAQLVACSRSRRITMSAIACTSRFAELSIPANDSALLAPVGVVIRARAGHLRSREQLRRCHLSRSVLFFHPS